MPDYHFLYIDKSLEVDWLFVAARRYWEHFRPIVVNDLDLIGYVPPMRSIAITVLSRRDMAKSLNSAITKRFPKAYFDPLVYDQVSQLQLTLDGRTDFDQRFGLPATPEPTRKKP